MDKCVLLCLDQARLADALLSDNDKLRDGKAEAVHLHELYDRKTETYETKLPTRNDMLPSLSVQPRLHLTNQVEQVLFPSEGRDAREGSKQQQCASQAVAFAG